MIRRIGLALVLALAAAAPAAAAPTPAGDWQRVRIPPPPGATVEVPVGFPGDLSFWAPNRGLMSVEGNTAITEGLYSWDGQSWHQLATVCGGGERARIVWAGPTEFWTIARPSLPRSQLPGFALCHFKDGEVVGSYSTPEGVDDPFNEMTAGACLAPNDCWFGGFGSQDGTGTRIGAFHLRWNGSTLTSVYNPQGRAVSDLLVHQGRYLESTYVGMRPDNEGFDGAPEPVVLAQPEDPPRLLHEIQGGTFVNDPFVPEEPSEGFPPDGTELRALSTTGAVAWAVGGGANSGPLAPVLDRRPLAIRRTGTEAWQEIELKGDAIEPGMVFGDVAAIPGASAAWVTLNPVNEGRGDQPTTPTRVAHIEADGTVTIVAVPGSGGAARQIACPAPDDCWLVTALGHVFRRSTAAPYARDEDPAFQGTITQRPNEAAGQFIPDTPPEDDSQLFAPPVEVQPEPEAEGELPPCRTLPSLVSRVKAKARGRSRLVVSFRLARPARIGIIARKGKKVVARTKVRPMKKGKRSLTLHVTPKRWPNKLRFKISGDKRPRKPCSGGSGSDDGDIVTSGPSTAATQR